jgi:hypothetical protein
MPHKEPWDCQTRRPRAPRGGRFNPGEVRTEMLPEDLMNPDLLSEVVLLGTAALIIVALLLIVAAVLTQPAALA